MATDPLAELDQRIATLRKRLDAAERIREAVKDDPELLRLLGASSESSATAANANGTVATRRGRPKKGTKRRIHGGAAAATYFKKIAEYLESHGNKPKSVPEIANATGLSKNSVIQACYKTHAILFEQHAFPGHATKKAWSLRTDWREIQAKESRQE